MRTDISQAKENTEKEITIKGFIKTIRDQKALVFFIVADRTGEIQVVYKKNEHDSLFETVGALTEESAVVVSGTVKENPQVKLGGVEVQLTTLVIAARSESPLPIAPDSSFEKQAEWRYLMLRRPEHRFIFEIQTELERAMRDFWYTEGFIEMHSPKLMSAASESGAEVFSVKYFETKAYLAQSPQFYKQMAMAGGFEKVFEIGPVFRAEPSFTTRHATEFTGVDMEISWIDSHDNVMDLAERWIICILTHIKETHGAQIRDIFGAEIVVPKAPFPRVTLGDAREIIEKTGHTMSPETDIDPEGERRLAMHIQKQTGSEFVFITDYPIQFRPFYHMRYPDTPTLTRSFDVLWKGVEITTGAQREHRLDILTKQAEEKGMDCAALGEYFKFFRHGCPPHGGVGIGLARMLMLLLNRPNVREVTYLHRGPNRLTP